MNTIFKLVVNTFALIGFVLVVLVTVGLLDNEPIDVSENDGIELNISSEPDSATVQEFLAVLPRANWPKYFDENMDRTIEKSFVESFEQSGVVHLTFEQRKVVRKLIVPRLKELMARAVDKAVEMGYTDAQDIVDVMLKEADKQAPYYAAAIAKILLAVPTGGLATIAPQFTL